MIQLRGGIDRLMKENRALALKPLRYVHVLTSAALFSFFNPFTFFEAERLTTTRLDVELALQTGLPTLFHSDAVIPANEISGDSCIIEEQLLSIIPRLSCIMLSVISFASLLNSQEREGQTKLDPLNYTETLVSLLYRLLDFAPLGQPHFMSGELYDNLAHLAMLTFMTTLLPNYAGDDSSHLLSDRLKSAIQDHHVASTDTQDSGSSLLLWTLFIGGVSVLKCKDYRWLTLETCERLNLCDWLSVRDRLCGFPWIHTLHDVPGRCLWEDAQRRSTEISGKFLRLEA